MKQTRSTKRALLSAVLALTLCLSSLLGTTFAWFTDSVSSNNNIIKSGNLDVELEYATVTDGQISGWQTVEKADKIFDPNALWEPGRVEVVYLKVSNLGTLALKYQLAVNIVGEDEGTNVNGEKFKLSDYLVFKVIDMPDALTTYTDREAAQLASGTAMGLKDHNGQTTNLEVGDVDYVAMIVYMPESVGNKANYRGDAVPTITLGVNLYATQKSTEADSFGPDYDKDAKYDSNAVVNGNATESTTLETESANVEIPAGAEGGTYVLETTAIKTETDANGVVTATMDITLFRNGEKAEAADPNKPFVVTVNIGAGLNLTKVLHNNVELTDYTYDIATGDLTFKTTHFSPFAFVYDNGADVATLDELLAALATDTRVINLKNDIEAREVVLIGRSVMINGNGYKVTSNATRVFRVTTNDVDVILNDVNMVSTAVRVGSNDVRGISIDIVENVKLTLNNCTVDFTDASANDWAYAVNVTGGANHTVTVNGGAYEGANLINVRSAKSAVTVKNATLTSTYPNTEAYIDLNYFGACIYVLKNQGTSVYASGNTYIGDNAVAYNLGVGNFLEEGDNVDNATSLAVEARIGGAIYDTLAKAVAAANAGDKVVLIRDIVLDETVVIDGSVVIDGNGKTITYTGADRAIDVPSNADAKVNVTLEGLTVDCTASYCQRGVNYNDDGAFTLNNVTVKGTNVTYAVNLPGYSDNCVVEINNSNITGNIALNIWGANSKVAATNTVFTSVDNNTAEGYAAISLNNDSAGNAATGSVVTINGGKIIAKDENGKPSIAVRVETIATVDVSAKTEVIGSIVRDVAIVTYEGYNEFYSFDNLQDAIDKAIASKGTVKLLENVTVSEIVVINGSVVIDGNGKTLTYTGVGANARAINVSGAVTVTIKNLTIDAAKAERAINVIQGAANVTINNVTATAANYTVNAAGSAAGAKIAIKNSNLTGLNVVNICAKGAQVTVDDTVLTCNDQTDVENYAALVLHKDAIDATIVATGVTFDIKGDSLKAKNGAIGGSISINGETDLAKIDVAYISYGDNYYGFATLEEAIAKAQNGETIVLIRDIVSADGVLITDKNITIDLNGKTFTVTEGASTNNRNFKVNGTSEVTIKNGTMIAAGELTSGAYGTVRTEGAAKVTLENLKLYSYRGYGLNVKACSGTTIVINDCEIYAQYSGGVEAAGGTIELNNTKIEQKGIYSSAAWCSVAIGVNGGGKVIVNSGDYSASAISTDANAAQGTWVAYVMSSGGTLEINGGTFNGVVAETATAANACGVICADRAAVVNINGGTFNSNGAILDMRNNVGSLPNPVATLAGGAFSADPRVSGLYSSNLIKVAEGYEVVETNGVWTVTAK